MSYPGRTIFILCSLIFLVGHLQILDGFMRYSTIRLLVDIETVGHFLSIDRDQKGRTPQILVGHLPVLPRYCANKHGMKINVESTIMPRKS